MVCFFRIDGYKTYFGNKIKIPDNYDISNLIDINFDCSVCSEEKAISFCDKCNQLFGNHCFEQIEKYENKDNKCVHNLQNIAKMKEPNEKGKKFFLNSLIFFIKIFLLKSNYLLNNQSQKLKLIKEDDANRSKIDFILKKFFEYPIINKIDDSTEINFLKSINNILVNNFENNNIDFENFNISELEPDLKMSLNKIFNFMDEKIKKNNKEFEIEKLVKKNKYIDDVYDTDVLR